MIENVVWILGQTDSNDESSNGLASHWYSCERGTNVISNRPTEWTGKIGLMYPSDYGYATSGGSTTNRETCLAKVLHYWDASSYSDCKDNNWLFMNGFWQRLLIPDASVGMYVFGVDDTGRVSVSHPNFYNVVRPSVYLTSSVRISDGDGSSASPYIIKASTN